MKKVGSFRVSGNNAKQARHFTRFVLNFESIEHSYKAVNAEFCKYLTDNNTNKDRMQATSTRKSIPAMLKALQFPPEVIPVHSENSNENNETIKFRDFLILTSRVYLDNKEKLDLENETIKEIGKGFDLVKEMFDVIDEDGSGFIEKDEFKQTLMPLTNNENLVNERMDELDLNHDHQVSQDEFMFDVIDEDGSGFIEKDEFK